MAENNKSITFGQFGVGYVVSNSRSDYRVFRKKDNMELCRSGAYSGASAIAIALDHTYPDGDISKSEQIAEDNLGLG